MHFILLSKELSSVKGMGVPCQLVGLGPGSSASSVQRRGAPRPTFLLPALAWTQPLMSPGAVAQQGWLSAHLFRGTQLLPDRL